MQHVHVAEAHAAHEGVEDAFIPQIIWHEGGNDTPDEQQQRDVELTLETDDRVIGNVRHVDGLACGWWW